MVTVVSLARAKSCDDSEEIRNTVHHAVDMVDFKPRGSLDTVLIKPNLCYYWDYTTGETTDPRVVSALIDYVRERYDKNAKIKIIESDASAMRTRHAFTTLGYRKLAATKSVELVNLSKGEISEREVRVGKLRFKLAIPRLLENPDLFINAPKLKVGPYASGKHPAITCAMKNLFGCIATPRKVKYHPLLNEVIVGVNKLIAPHLTLIDGIIALSKHPINLGLIVASESVIAADFVAAQIMGYNPYNIKHLSLAIKEKEEWSRLVGNIKVVGEDIDTFQSLFPKRNNFLFAASWGLQLSLLNFYLKLSGDNVPPIM